MSITRRYFALGLFLFAVTEPVQAKSQRKAKKRTPGGQGGARPPSPVKAGTYFPNCAAARAAGAAPLRAGQPGYSRKLDRDGDGVACE